LSQKEKRKNTFKTKIRRKKNLTKSGRVIFSQDEIIMRASTLVESSVQVKIFFIKKKCPQFLSNLNAMSSKFQELNKDFKHKKILI
jgi:hypothetical protein